MVKRVEVLAVVQARGGSKGIPRKNIKPLHGIPLIAYSIAAGLQAKLVGRVIVSTDDNEIANIAKKFGAEVPFIRPAKYAQDDSRDLPVFVHALQWLNKHEGYFPDLVVQLRPTSPFRPHGLIDKAIRILRSYDADSVRGVIPAGQNPHKMWRIIDENSPMQNLLDVEGIEEPFNEPRQVLPPIYWQTGHIDVIRPSVIQNGSMSGKKIYPLIIDSKFSIDLDNLRDWSRAEWLMDNLELPIIKP